MLGGQDARRLLHEAPGRLDILQQLTQTSRTGSFTLGVCPVLGDGTGAHAAAAIARAAAEASAQRILLVENGRKASLMSGGFGVALSAPGLHEMMLPPPSNRFDTIHRTDLDNLFLLPSGGFRKPAVGGTAAQVEWVHRMLNAHFPGIVMELPPMGEWLSRPRLAAHHIPDAVVLVASAGRVGTWAVKRAVRRLKEADANLLGSLLT